MSLNVPNLTCYFQRDPFLWWPCIIPPPQKKTTWKIQKKRGKTTKSRKLTKMSIMQFTKRVKMDEFSRGGGQFKRGKQLFFFHICHVWNTVLTNKEYGRYFHLNICIFYFIFIWMCRWGRRWWLIKKNVYQQTMTPRFYPLKLVVRGVSRIKFGEVRISKKKKKWGWEGYPSKTHHFWPIFNSIMVIFVNFLDFVIFSPSFFLIFVQIVFLYPQNHCDSITYPQWLASTGPVVGVPGVLGLKLGQDIMTSIPPSVFFHSSFSSFPYKNTYCVRG